MLEITARVFENGKLAGYQVKDGFSYNVIDSNTIAFMAKNGNIRNVKATQDGITGINGFELRKLPQINKPSTYFQTNMATRPSVAFTNEQKRASVIRYNLYYRSVNQDTHPLFDDCIRDEVASRGLNPNTLSTLSNHIEIINELVDDNNNILGYQIGYTGKSPLTIQRYENMPSTIPGKTVKKESSIKLTMNQGDMQYISTKELGYLAIKPEVSLRLNNAFVNIPILNTTRNLDGMKVEVSNAAKVGKLRIYNVLDATTINKFFNKETEVTKNDVAVSTLHNFLTQREIMRESETKQPQPQESPVTETQNKDINKAVQKHGLFNAFKR